MDRETPTRGQLERTLAQRLQALYREQLGQQPSRVTCQILDQKIVILLEGAITKPEQVLVGRQQEELARQVRADLDQALQPQIKALIEEIFQVPVVDLLSDATLETGRSGMIAILQQRPEVLKPEA